MKIVLAGIESAGDKSLPGSEALSRLRSRYDVHRVYARAGAPDFFILRIVYFDFLAVKIFDFQNGHFFDDFFDMDPASRAGHVFSWF